MLIKGRIHIKVHAHCTHTPTRIINSLTQLPTHSCPRTVFFFALSHTLTRLLFKKNFTEGALPHEHVNVLTVDPVTEESCSAESQLPGDKKDTKPSFDCSYASTLLF